MNREISEYVDRLCKEIEELKAENESLRSMVIGLIEKREQDAHEFQRIINSLKELS